MSKILIELNEFPIHIAKTKNKVAPNKYIKINNQAIYNGALNKFGRAIAIDNMHEYISNHLHKYSGLNLSKNVYIEYSIYTVINHGSVSRRQGVVCYKPPSKTYIPNWDIENLASIWIKAGNDALVKCSVISDDNVGVIKGISYKFIPVESLDERKIVIEINHQN